MIKKFGIYLVVAITACGIYVVGLYSATVFQSKLFASISETTKRRVNVMQLQSQLEKLDKKELNQLREELFLFQAGEIITLNSVVALSEDPEEIDRIKSLFKRIRAYWEENPDLYPANDLNVKISKILTQHS